MSCGFTALRAFPHSSRAPLLTAIRHFYDPHEFRTVVVFDGKTPVAGIPLVRERFKKLLPAHALPNNPWGQWGDLLVDRRYDHVQTCEALWNGLNSIAPQIFYLTDIPAFERRWQKFFLAAEKTNRNVAIVPTHFVGMVQHDAKWSDFESRLSRGFRKKLRKYQRQLADLGCVSFEHHLEFDRGHLKRCFDIAFGIENLGWKGTQNSSVLAAGQWRVFLENARHLASAGELRISFLKIDGKPIAFEFGVLGKRIYHSWKIGYDPAFAKYAPGTGFGGHDDSRVS